jgi:hypothetical protein
MLPPSNSGFRKRHRRAFREDITLPSPLADLDRKKAEIAYEALYAFAFEGYHKTTLGAIARMCRIGRTTIYEYFRNKVPDADGSARHGCGFFSFGETSKDGQCLPVAR